MSDHYAAIIATAVRLGERAADAIRDARRKAREQDIKDDAVGEFADKFGVQPDTSEEGVLPKTDTNHSKGSSK